MLCPVGYFKEVYEYNDNQQAIKPILLGVNGKSIDCKDGYSKIELTYNKDGEMESRKYTNASGGRDSADTKMERKRVGKFITRTNFPKLAARCT